MYHQKQNETGSIKPGEPVFLVVGHLQRPHGIKGEIAMKVLTDFPERLRMGKTVLVGEDHHAMKIEHLRWKQDLMLIQFEGVVDREMASRLTNLDVFVSSEKIPKLPEGEYYHHELLGLQVYQEQVLLGELSEILVTGANDVYVIRQNEGREFLLPALQSVIVAVDLENGCMEVVIPEGLIT